MLSPDCTVMGVLPQLSFHGRPVPTFLSLLSCSGHLSSLSVRLDFPGCSVPAFVSWHDVLSQLFFPGNLVTSSFAPHPPSCPYCHALTLQPYLFCFACSEAILYRLSCLLTCLACPGISLNSLSKSEELINKKIVYGIPFLKARAGSS
jgi:hypothetical protein